MAYHEFTMATVRSKLGLTIHEGADLFGETPEAALPADLAAWLALNVRLAIDLSTEKARSELIVAPMLFRIRHLYPDRVSVFSGVRFNIDVSAGLMGRCDYLISRDPSMLSVRVPVCALVEAKAENIVAGIPQCLAEMVAAQKFNADAESETPIYGAVTSGTAWRFLRLVGTTASVDGVEYPIDQAEKIFGILTQIALGSGDDI